MHLPALFPRVDFPTLSLPTLSEGSNTDTADDRHCKPAFAGSWFQWCPIDFVIWAIISSVIILMAWKLYSKNRVGPAATRIKGRKSNPLKKNGYYRLSFPHPTSGYSMEDASPPYVEKNKYGQGHEHFEFAGPTDPYHVVSTLDDSLIARDHQFKHATMPEPVLSDKRAEKPSSLGFSPERDFSSTISRRIETDGSNLSAMGQELPGINTNIPHGQSGTFFSQHALTTPNMPHLEDRVVLEATPPPVYIPNPRLDTI